MALVDRALPNEQVRLGSAAPQLSPPTPARSQVREFIATAAELGIRLYPWQEIAARFLTALGSNGLWLYPEVAVIVARQNGKTRLLVPLIISRLLAGQRIMHTAQNRELPREVFGEVADIVLTKYADKLKSRPRFANGQEFIKLRNGGSYRIVAPNRGGARGPSSDLVIIDELREMIDNDFIGAAKPTLTASANPQMVYLSNAGTEDSVVLNALRARADADPSLAYLQWAAAPQRRTDDVDGWYEGNPSMGHNTNMLSYLTREHRSMTLANTLHIFNTEHLCRWTPSDLPGLVEQITWTDCRRVGLAHSSRPSLAVSVDPSGERASIAIAWQDDEGIAVKVIGDVTGSPIDNDALGKDVRRQSVRLGATKSGYDPETDAELAKYLRNPQTVIGAKFTAACSLFVNLAESGRLRWEGPDEMSEDIRWTARLVDPQDGTFKAVKAKADRPITSVLAAIRAVSLASGPRPIRPKVL